MTDVILKVVPSNPVQASKIVIRAEQKHQRLVVRPYQLCAPLPL